MLVTRIRLRLSCQPYTAAAIHGCCQYSHLTIPIVSASPATTPMMFSRRLSPPGSPNSATARVDKPMARTAKVEATIRVLRRVCWRQVSGLRGDRKDGVEGKGVAGRVERGGGRYI